MSLTTGRGPLGPDPAGVFDRPVPTGVVYVEPFPRRVRGMKDGTVVVDSERVVLVHRPTAPPTYGFAADDVHGVTSEPVREAAGFVQVRWDAVDAWFEEDEQVGMHPRNPYHRIDILATHRRLRVTVEDTVLVDTTDAVILYETGLAPKLYVHPRLVAAGVLSPSTTTTYCPYKGTTTYWSATVGDTVVPDVAWSYGDPFPESTAIRGLLSFEPSRVTVETDLPAPVELRY
ncbi:MAG TPA: DUF427 domain-containing protein [Acidimicrobiales bacterium]|nr:DUF427 domain-containing protein [Acidimicrobiales bacterium]